MKISRIHYVLCAILFSITVKAQTTNYQVYSLYVVNIAKYSSWPSLSGELNITVLWAASVFSRRSRWAGSEMAA